MKRSWNARWMHSTRLCASRFGMRRTGRLQSAMPDRCPPLLCRAGEIISTWAEGVPIGLLEDREYEQVPILAQPQDLLLFYSDGVEDQLSDHEDYGRARLEKLVLANCGKPPKEI